MKKLLLFLSAILIGTTSQAAHVLGGELRYEYTGSAYKVELALYSDCSSGQLIAATQNVTLHSATCGTINVSVSMYASDTLLDVYCPSAGASCVSASLTAYRVITRYSGIVTAITPCSDWKFSYTEGSRLGGIVNIVSPSSQNLYLEAFLNNLTAPNSSPVFGTDPAFATPVSSNVVTPFHALDIEGDSTYSSFYTPQSTASSNVMYSIGYSAASPLPGYATINSTAGLMNTSCSISGKFLLAARIYDYRNGVMVGYSSRDWVMGAMGILNPKTPLPAAGSNFVTTACPGGPSSISFNFIDSVATDSVYLSLWPQNSYSYSTAYSNGVGSATAITTWTNPTSLNPAVTPYYFLKIRVRDNQCPTRGSNTYTVLVRTAVCTADSVWPGDANADKIVNMYDPLYIALANGRTGAARTGATTSWLPQVCTPWSQNFNIGINIKHADCDGNGAVNNSDLAAITTNYGQVHLRGTEEPQYRGTGLPDLYFDHTGIVAIPGNTITIPIKLGTATQSMPDMLGLAAKISVSNISVSGLGITYPSSWIGNAANTIRFTKNNGTNTLDWAYARTNQQNVNGQGQIAALTFTVPTGSNGQKFVLSMSNVKIIDASGTDISQFNVLSDTITIAATGINGISTTSFNAVIVPNPSFGKASLMMNLQKAASIQIVAIDLTGRNVWQSALPMNAGTQEVILPTSLRNGIYILRIGDGNNVEMVKWIKAE